MKMKFLIYISLFLFWGNQYVTGQSLSRFNSFLGEEKSEIIDNIVISFDNFLDVNYPKSANDSIAITRFLQDMAIYNIDSLIFDGSYNYQILDELEKIKFRKEIARFGFEEYDFIENKIILDSIFYEPKSGDIVDLGELNLEDDIEIELPDKPFKVDTVVLNERLRKSEERHLKSLHSNIMGDYYLGLSIACDKNDRLYEILKTMYSVGGGLSWSLIAPGLLESKADFANPVVKRYLIFEIYFWLLVNDCEKRHANKN